MSILNVEHLTHGFGDRAIFNDVSFRLLKGEHIGLVGANGEGKSTFMSIVTGKMLPDEGKVEWSKNVHAGYLDQHAVLEKGMTIRQALKSAFDPLLQKEQRMNEICDMLGTADEEEMNALMEELGTIQDELTLHDFYTIDAKVEEVARALGLLDLGLDRDVTDLSGGQRTKVLLAKLLLEKPDILLLDEPTSQLDPQGSEEVFHTVELLTQTGITIFMIEQKMEKLASYCDKILLLHEGKQVAFDTPEKIFSRPDLAELGICPPYVTRYCVEQHLFRPDGTYPVVVEDVKEALKRDKERKVTLPQLADTVLAEAPENRFDVRNLKFSYTEDHPIFENFQLSLDQRPTAIIGQNGAGKTTLVRLLKGLLKPSAGTILYQGEDISRRTVASLAGQVGYVFQNPDDQIFKYKVIDEVCLVR